MAKVPDRWIRTRADEAAVDQGCTFDAKAAERVRRFFRTFLRHSKGEFAGKPFDLLDWQWEDIVAPLFGWKRSDGSRRYRIAYIEVPKKNGKSALASGIGLYLLVGDGEAGAEVYSTGSDSAQASIVHGEAIAMVKASPGLSSYLKLNESTHNIAFPQTGSWYRALSGEHAGKEGLNAHGLVVDELHVWRGDKTWNALKYAGRARRQPLRFVITTAGDDKLSVCYQQHEYSQMILKGEVTDTRFFPYIRAAGPEDDWKAPETWRKANPSLGVTINEAEFAADVAEAEKTPSTQAAFKRYSLDIWAVSTNPWLKPERWQACGLKYGLEDLVGMECCGGLDLAKTQDMVAFVLCFRAGEEFRLWPWFWLPEDAAEDKDKPEQYRVWRDQGLLEVTAGPVTDYGAIKRRLVEIRDQTRFSEYAFDPWNAEATTQELEVEANLKRVQFDQTGRNFNEPTKEFERLVIAGKMRHPNHPILNWQAGNVQVKTDSNGNIKPVKPPHGDQRKIDGMVAAIMAFALARKQSTESWYTKGCLTS